MKRFVITLLILLTSGIAFADSVFIEGFEYANHDGEVPVGWVCDDNSWLCGYLEKDHNRKPHAGNWYVYTDSDDSWMFMELYMNPELKYRYYFWAIADGEYDIEFWAGSGPSTDEMTTLLFTKTVNNDEYIRYSEYIEDLTNSYQYFGIRAIAHEGAFRLTIDDIEVDMVVKYEIAVNPTAIETVLAPGEQTEFSLVFYNLGFEPANVIIHPYSDYFTDITFSIDGTTCTTFHAEPDAAISLTGTATLLPDIEIGTRCWSDIFFVLDCNCATTMFTLWATAGYESTDEFGITTTSIYPNPSNGDVTIEGNGAVTITNILGQIVMHKEIVEKETVTLDSGIYFVRKDGEEAQKLIIR